MGPLGCRETRPLDHGQYIYRSALLLLRCYLSSMAARNYLMTITLEDGYFMCTPQYASVFAENKVWGGPLSVLCFSASGLVYPIPRIKYGSDIVTSSVLSFHNLVIPLDPMLRCAFIHGTWSDQTPPPSSDQPLLCVRVGSFYTKYR